MQSLTGSARPRETREMNRLAFLNFVQIQPFSPSACEREGQETAGLRADEVSGPRTCRPLSVDFAQLPVEIYEAIRQ